MLTLLLLSWQILLHCQIHCPFQWYRRGIRSLQTYRRTETSERVQLRQEDECLQPADTGSARGAAQTPLFHSDQGSWRTRLRRLQPPSQLLRLYHWFVPLSQPWDSVVCLNSPWNHNSNNHLSQGDCTWHVCAVKEKVTKIEKFWYRVAGLSIDYLLKLQ